MRRREFIAGLGGAAALPLTARAQPANSPVIGFMHVASAGPMSHLVAAFRRGLQESGVADAPNIPMESRWADGQYDRLKGFAEDLADRRVGVIVTGGGDLPALAAQAATSTIPIVFNIGNDPVKAGLVASIGRPGGNITGVNILTGELATKRLGLLHDLLPKGVGFAHLVNPSFRRTEIIVEDVAEAARTMGR
jgi:putative ABC transport system substrate-binding protein